MDQSTEAEKVLEQTTDASTCLSFSHEHGRLDRTDVKSEKTNFGDLPGELQENISHRALVDIKTLASCKCVSFGWFEFCQRVTFTVGKFVSVHHESDPFYHEADGYGPTFEHWHALYSLSSSRVGLVVSTCGRKHRGGLLLKFQDSHGSPCSVNQWLTGYGSASLPEGIVAQQAFSKTCKSRLSVKALGVEVLLQTDGRKHQGEVKLLVGDFVEASRNLCAYCTGMVQILDQ